MMTQHFAESLFPATIASLKSQPLLNHFYEIYLIPVERSVECLEVVWILSPLDSQQRSLTVTVITSELVLISCTELLQIFDDTNG